MNEKQYRVHWKTKVDNQERGFMSPPMFYLDALKWAVPYIQDGTCWNVQVLPTGAK